MNIIDAINHFDIILENGPLGTRLKYDYGYETYFDLTEKVEGRKALLELYEGDIAVAQEYQIPMILNAATFRANRNHLIAANFKTDNDLTLINEQCINFIREIRNKHSNSAAPLFLGAPLGSMYDAYTIEVIPSVEEAKDYHAEQINIFKKLDVDLLNVVTIPTLAEAKGIALAANASGLFYTIGFILNEHATLLDGTTLEAAILAIDAIAASNLFGYTITCTHSSIIKKLTESPERYHRLIGIKPNGSNLSTESLAKLNKPVSDSPVIFAKELLNLKKSLNLKLLGGCCGTTREHLIAIAKLCNPILSLSK